MTLKTAITNLQTNLNLMKCLQVAQGSAEAVRDRPVVGQDRRGYPDHGTEFCGTQAQTGTDAGSAQAAVHQGQGRLAQLPEDTR